MGQILGISSTKEPPFTIIYNQNSPVYELRYYSPIFVAEVPMKDDDSMNTAFRTLANYIGAFGNPQNEISKITN